MPTTPGSPFLQSVFSAPTPAAVPLIKDPNDVMANAVTFSKEFLRKYFLLWYWASYTAMRGLGFDFGIALLGALICMVVGCLVYGAVKAEEEWRKAKNLGPGRWQPPTIPGPPPAQQFSLSLTPQVITPLPPATPPPSAVTPTISDPFVGNIVLGIYHVENCDWVDHISTKNRVGFSTASEALSHGFKPCRICSPAT